MSKLKCVIVEDSELQRMTLERIVNSHPDLVLVNTYRNAIEAKNGINSKKN